MNTPNKLKHSPDELRIFFEQKVVQNTGGSEKEKLDFIVSKLDDHHKEKVLRHNENLRNTFGSILLLVNYNDSQLINRLDGGSLGAVDMQDDTIAFIMGYNESVQGHGVRYLCEYGICENGKIVSTGPMQYRGAYAHEEDHWEKAYNEIKLLDVNEKYVIFGVKSGKQLLLQKLDRNSGTFETLKKYDLEQEARDQKEKELKETLQASSWKESIDDIESLILTKERSSRSRIGIKDTYIGNDFAIFPVVQYDYDYDASDINYALYMVGDQYPEPIILKKWSDVGYNWSRSGRFFTNGIRLSFNPIDSQQIEMTIKYRHADQYSAYTLAEKTSIITLPKRK